MEHVSAAVLNSHFQASLNFPIKVKFLNTYQEMEVGVHLWERNLVVVPRDGSIPFLK